MLQVQAGSGMALLHEGLHSGTRLAEQPIWDVSGWCRGKEIMAKQKLALKASAWKSQAKPDSQGAENMTFSEARGCLWRGAASILNKNTVHHSEVGKSTQWTVELQWCELFLICPESTSHQWHNWGYNSIFLFSGTIHWTFLTMLVLNKASILELSVNICPVPDIRTIFPRINLYIYLKIYIYIFSYI